MLNDYYQNIGVKGFIQRYGIVNAVKRGAFMFIKLHLVKDYEVRKVLWQERASTKIKPYLKYKDTDIEGLSFPENDVENPIWIYWNKGIEQAPIIVQKCYESVCEYSNQKIILLNDQNLADYIRLPDYIEKKKDAGQIPMAGYADLMRFALLEHYGGTWIDSTVYLTEPLPDTILNSDFFAVRNSLLLIDNPVLYPAWFLHKNADLDDFGRMLDHTWRLKRQTGSAVSTNSIDDLYAKGVAAGALGGKLLGAGGGGFLVFYAQPERQDAVRWAMRDLMHIPFAFEDGGTRVIHYTPEAYEPNM